MSRSRLLSFVIVSCLLSFSGCSDGASGVVSPDSTVDSSPVVDAFTVDAAPPDFAMPDQAVLDLLVPDQMVPDQVVPDQMVPDQMVPDQVVPDLYVPDLYVPDLLIPDLPPPTCTDKMHNGDETDVDCGGMTCAKCADTYKCKVITDCLSGVCIAGVCAAASCADKVQNGYETDVDCGGLSCPKCAAPKKCGFATDCLSGVCAGGKCAASTCTDKVKNGDETDVDCGGATCSTKCLYAKGCKLPADCVSGVCDSSSHCGCAKLADCAKGYNCMASKCVAAKASCKAQKTAYPTSTDRMYWINGASGLYRAHCDMKLKVELCNETQGTHKGKTREGSALAYSMVSLLLPTSGVCEIWAVRSTSGNYPLDNLKKVTGLTLRTCAALGFVSDDKLGSCKFGKSYSSNCGYAIGTNYYRYGNACSGCTQYDGTYKTYKLQGYMNSASVISTMNGKTRSRCKVE